MAGVAFGFPVMILVIGFGLGKVFELFPVLYTVLRYLCAAYLLVLAWKIARADGVEGKKAGARPMTFVEALLFQWVNPKAWIMALSTIAAYVPRENFFIGLLIIDGLFVPICFGCVLLWTGCGHALRDFLRHPRAVRVFNVTMALLLVASLVPIFKETAVK